MSSFETAFETASKSCFESKGRATCHSLVMGCCESKAKPDLPLTIERAHKSGGGRDIGELDRLAGTWIGSTSSPATVILKKESHGRACEVTAPDPVMLLVKRVMQSVVQAAKRPAQLKRLAALPEHLRLGVTLAGMRKLLAELRDKIPRDRAGKPKYPGNLTLNGYCNQILLAAWEKEDKLAVCERLQKQGSPHVGEATVFVSWFLNTPIATLLDALANFLEQKGLREDDTFFWVCDYVIRQTDVDPDLALLGECVSALGHTVLLMEPWHAPKPLKRAYCIKEVYHTQVSE